VDYIRIAILADGNIQIGFGHIMRCMSLARELIDLKKEVIFLSSYIEGIEKLKDNNYNVLVIKDINNQFNNTKKDLKQKLIENKIEILILDKYNIKYDEFLYLKGIVKKVCYIDDLNEYTYPVDVLINGNITGSFFDYKKHSKNEIFLLGTKYNLIRREFRNKKRKTLKNDVKKILLTTGGSDPNNATEFFIDLLIPILKRYNIKLEIVLGKGYNRIDALYKIINGNKYININIDVDYMSTLMLDADIAISAGGSTLYELCATGTPTIAFIIAENQKEIVEHLEKNSYILSLGWFKNIKLSAKDIILDMIKNYTVRYEFFKKSYDLVDGYGAKRVAMKIINSYSEV
jgi:UDP-2,4-diacetamido-2,4,6-trideoxy-beta-L-altropyranose hydrolase